MMRECLPQRPPRRIADRAAGGQNVLVRKTCKPCIGAQRLQLAGRARTVGSDFLSVDASRKGAADS
jgi:hypothetical protein